MAEKETLLTWKAPDPVFTNIFDPVNVHKLSLNLL